MDELTFVIAGDPKSKGRPRFTRGGRTYTPKTTAEAEHEISKVVLELMGEIPPLEDPCGMRVRFYCKTMRRTDGDNLMKLVLDALNGVAYADDYLVEEVSYRLWRKAEGEEPRTEVTIYRLDGEHQ